MTRQWQHMFLFLLLSVASLSMAVSAKAWDINSDEIAKKLGFTPFPEEKQSAWARWYIVSPLRQVFYLREESSHYDNEPIDLTIFTDKSAYTKLPADYDEKMYGVLLERLVTAYGDPVIKENPCRTTPQCHYSVWNTDNKTTIFLRFSHDADQSGVFLSYADADFIKRAERHPPITD